MVGSCCLGCRCRGFLGNDEVLDNGQESTQEMVPALRTSAAVSVIVVFSLSSDNGVHQ